MILENAALKQIIQPMIVDMIFICSALNISFEQFINELYLQYLKIYHPAEFDREAQRGKK